MPFRIAAIVEGKGEQEALPVLLRRLLAETGRRELVQILKPIVRDRYRMVKEDYFRRSVELAAYRVEGHGAVLALLDSEGDCPADLSHRLRGWADEAAWNCRLAVVVAHMEFEAWFLVAAGSLAGRRDLPAGVQNHPNPEGVRGAKGWLAKQMGPGRSYSEVRDQPALTAWMDLKSARRATSFEYFCTQFTRLVTDTEAA